MKIQTKTFNYGHENESSWPSEFGTRERGVFYIDKSSGSCVSGFPPSERLHFGDSAYVIGDTIDKYYHPAAQVWTESRKELVAFDKATGSITTDKQIHADSNVQRRNNEAYAKDRKNSLIEASKAYEQGYRPAPQKQNAEMKEAIDKAVNSSEVAKGEIYRD